MEVDMSDPAEQNQPVETAKAKTSKKQKQGEIEAGAAQVPILSTDTGLRPCGCSEGIIRPGHIQKPGHVQGTIADVQRRLAYVQGQLDTLSGMALAGPTPGDALSGDAGADSLAARMMGTEARAQFQIQRAPDLLPANSLTIQPEAAPCRPRSALTLLPGVIQKYSVPLTTGDISITFYLNPAHLILPGVQIASCPNSYDEMVFLPSLSSNISAISYPTYVQSPGSPCGGGYYVTSVVYLLRTAAPGPFTFGFRIKYEENAAQTCLTNPKKKAGQITVNGPTVTFKEVVEP
jgi:hypothetical protein